MGLCPGAAPVFLLLPQSLWLEFLGCLLEPQFSPSLKLGCHHREGWLWGHNVTVPSPAHMSAILFAPFPCCGKLSVWPVWWGLQTEECPGPWWPYSVSHTLPGGWAAVGLGRAGHCVFHQLPSDSHIGDIRETARRDEGTQTAGRTLVSASSDGSKNSKMGVGVCVLRSDPHPQGQAHSRYSGGCIIVGDSATDPGRRDQKEKTNPGAEQDPGPRLGPHRPLKSVRSQTGYERFPEWGTICRTVQPPSGSLGCSEGKVTTTAKMTATCAGSRSVTHTPGEALCQYPFSEAHHRQEAGSLRVTSQVLSISTFVGTFPHQKETKKKNHLKFYL